MNKSVPPFILTASMLSGEGILGRKSNSTVYVPPTPKKIIPTATKEARKKRRLVLQKIKRQRREAVSKAHNLRTKRMKTTKNGY